VCGKNVKSTKYNEDQRTESGESCPSFYKDADEKNRTVRHNKVMTIRTNQQFTPLDVLFQEIF